MAGEGFKIRKRHRQTGEVEYQVTAGRKVVARYNSLEAAQKDYPKAELDASVLI